MELPSRNRAICGGRMRCLLTVPCRRKVITPALAGRNPVRTVELANQTEFDPSLDLARSRREGRRHVVGRLGGKLRLRDRHPSLRLLHPVGRHRMHQEQKHDPRTVS